MTNLDYQSKYIKSLQSGHYELYYKIELLFNDESFKEDITEYVKKGNVQVQFKNGVRRNCSLSIDNKRLDFIPNVDRLWIGQKFRVVLGLKNTDSENFEFPQGVFVISNPVVRSETSLPSVDIYGVDKFGMLDGTLGGELTDIHQIENGSNIPNFIRTTLNLEFSNGDKIDNIEPVISQENTNATTPYTIRHERGSNYGELLNEAVKVTSGNLFYNVNGELEYQYDYEDDTKGSIVDLYRGDKIYISATETKNYDKIYNAVTVLSDNVDGSLTKATVKNENYESGTNIYRTPERTKVYEEYVYDTDEKAREYATYLLKRHSRLNSSFDVSCMPIFNLDVDRVITITDDRLGYEEERLVLNSINLGFGTSSDFTMSINATNSNDISFEV